MIKPSWRQHLPAWKTEHRNVFRAKIDDIDFIFRAPTYGEFLAYKEFATNEGDDSPPLFLEYAEDALLHKVLLWPLEFDPDKHDMRVTKRLVSAIIKASKFNAEDFDKIYEFHREVKEQNGDYNIILMLCRAFPGLQPDDVAGWQQEKIVRYLVYAEDVLGWDLKTGPREPDRKSVAPAQTKSKTRNRTTTPDFDVMDIAANHPPPSTQAGMIDVDAEAAAIARELRG